jgi:hypothetical protein
MPVWASAAVISIFGVSTLTGLTFSLSQQTRFVAAIVPPWAAFGAGGAAILDMRWRGHLVVLDTRADATVIAGLRGQGLWLMDASGFQICGPTAKGA